MSEQKASAPTCRRIAKICLQLNNARQDLESNESGLLRRAAWVPSRFPMTDLKEITINSLRNNALYILDICNEINRLPDEDSNG